MGAPETGALFLFCKENEMARKYEQDPVTGLVRQPLIKIVVAGAFVFAVLIISAATLPRYSSYYLYVSIPVGILGYASLLWNNIKPNLYARFFQYSWMSVLCMITAFRAFDNLLPRFSTFGAFIIISTVVFAHTLPIWNGTITQLIRIILSAPRTKVEKTIFQVSLAFVPLMILLGNIISAFNKSAGLSVILLFLFWLMALILPFSYLSPNSPWENGDQ
jgi:hypothetical protein